MAATTPVSVAELEQIRVLHARGESCEAIAAALGRNKSTVSRQCRKLGLSFDRSATKAATDAKQADNKSRRAKFAAEMLDDIERLRERAWSAYKVVVGTAQGAEVIELLLPPLGEVRAAYSAIGTAFDKHLAAERHDSQDGGMSAVDEWLRGMIGETR